MSDGAQQQSLKHVLIGASYLLKFDGARFFPVPVCLRAAPCAGPSIKNRLHPAGFSKILKACTDEACSTDVEVARKSF